MGWMTAGLMERLWKHFRLGSAAMPEEAEREVRAFIRGQIGGAGRERDREEMADAYVRFVSYCRGFRHYRDLWLSPDEWERYFLEPLPGGAAVWARYPGKEWEPCRWGDARQLGGLEVLVCRGPFPPEA